ncbi:MAG: methionyl-tRNA synthetase, methionyl-tRNA synthetase [Candidatus Peregrinibacteria bacterium GW2011_GWC2_39_14]|nr:MAG: Methionine-tRNA ligase [Candidatus Peregrinibacteria bacterium GW2011_GWA2_38_36]KKR04371.1 MAG: methionyl-tRNA synthetase, methionyl-tRNA synthetase [Candidatus Peregrinibacteria bacterium GW2011_GWC2_39_14]
MAKFYVTTAIPYVNASPHIGFTMEILQADVLARYHRQKGDETYFLTGTDEHGTKLFNMAKKENTTPIAIADKYAETFKSLTRNFNITNDDFIRTTEERHIRGAQKLWKILADKGDIYKAKYSGLYCSGCEAYVLEKDLVEGKCSTHKTAPDYLEEENYFFKLSKYSDEIRKLIEKDKLKIVPEARKNEMLNIIGKEGLPDVSFSRPKKNLPWGIPVPDDSDHVMYVWCDALSNYITAFDFENDGANFKKFWPADVHIIGKDILRFHAGVWIGMLLSAGLKTPKNIYVHGFVTSDGQKMSKSLGNVVDPFAIIEKYGIDPVRYYLSREIPTTDDGDFSLTRFELLYNTELANNFGNFVNRVCSMTEKYFDSKIPKSNKAADKDAKTVECKKAIQDARSNFDKNVEKFDLKSAVECVMLLSDFGNRYVEEMKPWALAKENSEILPSVIFNMVEILRGTADMLVPFLPDTSKKVLDAISGDAIKKPDVLFPRLV